MSFTASHPVWVRGLKQHRRKKTFVRDNVAPRVGAWIETTFCLSALLRQNVAPRVGAWIETNDVVVPSQLPYGRTPCGCVD